jgi:hypothetical protein
MFVCFGCQRELGALDFLHEVAVWWPELDCGRRVCTTCGHREEVGLRPGVVELGYLYSAGTAHFAGVEERHVTGLGVERDTDGLRLRYAGEIWHVPVELIRR